MALLQPGKVLAVDPPRKHVRGRLGRLAGLSGEDWVAWPGIVVDIGSLGLA